ncbi:MAG: hypothetical protein V4510_09880 [bacterium]
MEAAAPPQSAPAEPLLTRDDDHKYWLIDPPKAPENLIGATEVEVEVGLENDDWYTDEHSSRGIAVHAELASAARGIQPYPFIDPDLFGWRQSGLDWLAEKLADGAVILGVEEMRWHPLYRFAGTLDIAMLWRGYEWVFDYKTGKASKVTRFKLAAYDMLRGPTANGKPRKRAAIELDRDGGRAHPVPYNDVEHHHDANHFLSHLTTARDKRAFGPKK